MSRNRGEMMYMIYRALTYGLTPLINLHLRWRKFRGLEHHLRWRERLGRPSLPRVPGPLFWFHAVSLGEGMAAIQVIKCCVQRRPDVTVLMTTTTTSAFNVIKNMLPDKVIYQFAPLDTPSAVDAFLGYWKPNAIVLIESELWPNLIMGASKNRVALGLVNARMSEKSFNNWSHPLLSPLTSLMLSKFSLISPLSTAQAISFQLLQAPPFIVNFAGDLKYAIEKSNVSQGGSKGNFEDLKIQFAQRKVWMASSIHKGEEKVMLGVHKVLQKKFPNLVTIIAPRHPQHGLEIALELQKEGVSVSLRSRDNGLVAGTSIYILDTLGELMELYRLTPIAVIGGSFITGSAGHNISEAAASGCAILTGHYVGHFSHMVLQMQRLNPLSVKQVSGELLVDALNELFSNDKTLEASRIAAKQAYTALSNGVVNNVWNLLDIHVFR